MWGVANTLIDISAPLGKWVYGLLLEGMDWPLIPVISGIIISVSAGLIKSKRTVQRIEKELGHS
ncbi:hypothetical protein [Paenibacillus sp. UNC499MF]|uniref:hypothetical protein n=1 Tax=Paenibacillus sp. UNC499MF TaxID=1502751 RepID=UPI0011B03F47|nr:hypothetical protein [Paenibacillus sp. UNC499MF]